MTPKLSICIPIHDMQGGSFFLWRTIQALMSQSFQDFEIVITQAGKMAENTNTGIKKARGEIIKILYLDDYLAHPDALKNIVEAFEDEKVQWLVTGCLHQHGNEVPHSPHYPEYTENLSTGNNRIGSPSVLSFRNKEPLLFDERLSWLLDCDLYQRLHDRYGEPTILNDLNIVIGLGAHQTTHLLPETEKLAEHEYLNEKYR